MRVVKSLYWAGLLTGAALFAQPPQAPAPAIDLSGYWTGAMHEDAMERGNGPEIADYAGFPINEAARLWGLSYNPSRVTLRHHQCDGYVMPYQVRAIGNSRSWEERDPHTQQLIAIHWWHQTFEGHRVIWMDGRPHPPAWAPHTWMGFSTGKFVGNALVVYTTHLKQGWLRRNGLPESDQATVTDFFVRHGDHITYTSVVSDPVYLAEPMVRTTDFYRQPSDPTSWLFACDDGEQILDRKPDEVPNFLFGQQPFVTEFSKRNNVPLVGALGGPHTMYPEFEAKLKGATEAEGLAETKPSAEGPAQTSRAVDPVPHDGEIHVWRLRNNVYLLLGDGANVTLQVGDEGAFVVDSGTGQLADKIIAAIKRLTDRPIQYIANTSARADHTGGNVKLRAAGLDPSVIGSFFSLQFADAGVGATIVAQQNVANRMTAAKTPSAGWPSDTFLEERRRMFHNNDNVQMFFEPNAVTDGDSIVQFQRADVIVAGDIFNTTQYPFIDVKSGGSVEGEIKALNDILNRTVYQHEGEGGTIVVPGHGYVCDEHEVVEYRDMVAIIRDRVQALIKGGATLEQVKAARVTIDYDTRYGATTGPWTTNDFVEAVYTSLKQPVKH
ncbi:MAG TPA: MBL fold metallo-hydrolase [Bryobacteraceae bacterium]|nr:MBL fold metallo-hydrolase [Bryobacteraceae bacterium]